MWRASLAHSSHSLGQLLPRGRNHFAHYWRTQCNSIFPNLCLKKHETSNQQKMASSGSVGVSYLHHFQNTGSYKVLKTCFKSVSLFLSLLTLMEQEAWKITRSNWNIRILFNFSVRAINRGLCFFTIYSQIKKKNYEILYHVSIIFL